MSRPGILPTVRTAFRPGRLDYLIFFVTSRCNARCRMCFNYRELEERKGRGDLDIEEIRKTASAMPAIFQLTISGGEPFMRDDLAEIVACFAGGEKVRQLTLSTNGLEPDKIETILSEILRRHPGLAVNLYVSLDAIGSKHDSIRGVDGAYDRAAETLRKIIKLKDSYHNLRPGVTSVMSSFNLDDIFPLLEYLEKSLASERIEVMLARGCTREPSAIDVPIEIFEKAHERLARRGRANAGSLYERFLCEMSIRKREVQIETVKREKMIVPCVAGRKMAVIEADGTVRPCEILHTLYPEKDFTLGSLRERDYGLCGILESEKARDVADFIRRTRCRCTFECAIIASLAFQPRQWLLPGYRALKGLMANTQ